MGVLSSATLTYPQETAASAGAVVRGELGQGDGEESEDGPRRLSVPSVRLSLSVSKGQGIAGTSRSSRDWRTSKDWAEGGRLSLGPSVSQSADPGPESGLGLGLSRRQRPLLRLSDDSPMMASSSAASWSRGEAPRAGRDGGTLDSSSGSKAGSRYSQAEQRLSASYGSWQGQGQEDMTDTRGPPVRRSDTVAGTEGLDGEEEDEKEDDDEKERARASVDSFKKFLRSQQRGEDDGEDKGEREADLTLSYSASREGSQALLGPGSGSSLFSDALGLSTTLGSSDTLTHLPYEEGSSLTSTFTGTGDMEEAVLQRAGRLESRAQAALASSSGRTALGGQGQGQGQGLGQGQGYGQGQSLHSIRSNSSDPASPFSMMSRQEGGSSHGHSRGLYSLEESGSDGDEGGGGGGGAGTGGRRRPSFRPSSADDILEVLFSIMYVKLGLVNNNLFYNFIRIHWHSQIHSYWKINNINICYFLNNMCAVNVATNKNS